MYVKQRKAEQSEATRGALLRAGRELFSDRAYAETATEEIVRRAGVTRGALYHHFRDKQDLFRAVYEEVERDVVQRVNAAAWGSGGDAWERVRVACHAFIDACLEPDVERIALVDAPSVLGWETWRNIDRQGVEQFRQGIERAMKAGLIERQPVKPLAHLLLGAVAEAVIVVSRAGDAETARREVGETLDRILNGMRR